MWMVRAGRGGEVAPEFLEKKAVAFGDERLGQLPENVTKDGLLALYAEKYPEAKEGSRASWASQLLRFVVEVKVGDEVTTFDREHRRYLLGKVTSGYEWMPNFADGKPHARRVEWTHQAGRDVLALATRNSLGSTLTIFKVPPDACKDLQANRAKLGSSVTLRPKPIGEEAEREVEALLQITEETEGKANEFIEDAINSLGWEQMQELVAGILRAMGYRTTVSRGADRGVDVFASPDGLGLQDPRIFVEVKHRGAPMGSKEIRSFVGGRSKGDKCLYVSTGGFTKDAHYEADRADVALTLITLPRLRQLVVDFYDRLDTETRALVPLRRVYWPVNR